MSAPELPLVFSLHAIASADGPQPDPTAPQGENLMELLATIEEPDELLHLGVCVLQGGRVLGLLLSPRCGECNSASTSRVGIIDTHTFEPLCEGCLPPNMCAIGLQTARELWPIRVELLDVGLIDGFLHRLCEGAVIGEAEALLAASTYQRVLSHPEALPTWLESHAGGVEIIELLAHACASGALLEHVVLLRPHVRAHKALFEELHRSLVALTGPESAQVLRIETLLSLATGDDML